MQLKFSELISQEYLGEAYNITKIKIYWNFNIFADLELLEFQVPLICLVIGCVLLYRDRRYT
jgi:hypothetical protein